MTLLTAQWLIPGFGKSIENGFIEIDSQGTIQSIGSLEQDFPKHPLPELGTLLTPGLVNVHTHLEQSWPDTIIKEADERFLDWIVKVVAFNRSGANPEDRRQRCRVGIEALLSTGTTCINDIAAGPESLSGLDEAGMRAIVSLEFFHPAPEANPERIDAIAQLYEEFSAPYQSHPLLKTGISPHAPYTISAHAWQAILARVNPSFVHTHVAEWLSAEALYLQGKGGPATELQQALIGKSFEPSFTSQTPISHLVEANLLQPHLVLAHCLETNADDRRHLEAHAHDLGIAHCPRSNVALHGQTLDWQDWAESPIAIGLGTDGRLSTEDLDLRAEARTAQKQHGWSDAETFDRLTATGARVIGMQDKIGQLKPGFAADCVLWHCEPTAKLDSKEDALAAFLSASTKAEAVYIQGQQRWQTASVHLQVMQMAL